MLPEWVHPAVFGAHKALDNPRNGLFTDRVCAFVFDEQILNVSPIFPVGPHREDCWKEEQVGDLKPKREALCVHQVDEFVSQCCVHLCFGPQRDGLS